MDSQIRDPISDSWVARAGPLTSPGMAPFWVRWLWLCTASGQLCFWNFLTLTLLDPFTSAVLPAFAPLPGLQGLCSPPVNCVPLLILPTPPETPLPPGRSPTPSCWTVHPTLPTACAQSCASGSGIHRGPQSMTRSMNQGRSSTWAQEVVCGPLGLGIGWGES